MSTAPAPRILFADDDDGYRRATTLLLRAHGFEVTAVGEGNSAILAFEAALVAKRPFDLLVLDIRMPGATGWDVLSYIRSHNPNGVEPPRCLLVTGFTTELDLDRLKRDGADGILLKPLMNASLVGHVRRALSLRHQPSPVPPSSF